MAQLVQAYLGLKGYALLKTGFSATELRQVRDALTVKPNLPKAPVQPAAFPVYRESPQKLYLPRYYGLTRYGPCPSRLPVGADLAPTLQFCGDLRDYQQKIVDVYLIEARRVGGGLLEIPCGRGKTVIALKVIASLRKKTLVIVHKGFLLSQWLERIAQFLPGARVGRIQGPVLDIADKDIVVGMLQSLSMKEYPDDLFASFGLTIVDECHHISSEVFSRSLQKVITPFTLGLSATMVRKDGLTHVFKMFLGEIVYSEHREHDDAVLVKGLVYKTNEAAFNEVVYDFRGHPAYSTMISKLCAHAPRSEFILQVLQKELALWPGQQVMILAHNKNVLAYLYQAIVHRKLATAGYYVGGMKEADLKVSETCQVIIATYAMAAEALDIKTLTTLILATPKTDVVQAVGRILRVKHARPLVIDIIDAHGMFRQQWLKRKKFYTSCNYQVVQCTSQQYLAQTNDDAAEEEEEEEDAVADDAVADDAIADDAVADDAEDAGLEDYGTQLLKKIKLNEEKLSRTMAKAGRPRPRPGSGSGSGSAPGSAPGSGLVKGKCLITLP